MFQVPKGDGNLNIFMLPPIKLLDKNMTFNTDSMTFAHGIQRLEHACKGAQLDINKSVITSRDAAVEKAVKALEVTNIYCGR